MCSPCAGRSPWGVGESSQNPGNRKGHFLPGLSSEMRCGLRKASICPNLKLGMSHENKIKLTADLVYIQLQTPSLFLWSCLCLLFYFLCFFKCQSSRTLPLTFQHLISQNTAPYLWQLQHVHLIEIEQNKSLSALNYVYGKYKILCVRLLLLFVVLALY